MPTAPDASDTPGKLGKPGRTPWQTLTVLTVLPAGWQAPVGPRQTLLQAARDAGLILPSACRNGSCRACMCQLVSGTIHYKIDWPGLLAEEKAEGWILPCVAEAASDVVIAAPAARGLPGR